MPTNSSKIFITPWKNKSELESLYKDLYQREDDESKERAISVLKLWKCRSMSIYPAGILATLVLLEADQKARNSMYSREDVQIFYSNAFTRFLNYVHSLTETPCSMYGAAQELGINAFIVDLRHLCSHGQTLPGLDIFQRCSASCGNWLKQFYWDHLLEGTRDVLAENFKSDKIINVEKEFDFLLQNYDFIAEQIRLRAKVVKDIKIETPPAFNQYTKSLECDNLMQIRGQLLKDLVNIFETSNNSQEIRDLFCSTFIERVPNFLLCPTKQTASNTSITIVHQNLFWTLANHGIIPPLLSKLLKFKTKNESLQTGALFWANEILRTCSAVKEVKAQFLKEMDDEHFSKINWNSINTKHLDPIITSAFETRNMTRNNSLLFGVAINCPWRLVYDKKEVEQLILETKKETKEININLLQFVEPPLEESKKNELVALIKLYASQFEEPTETNLDIEMDSDVTIKEAESKSSDEKDWGIWSQAESDNWSSCPIGVLPWQKV